MAANSTERTSVVREYYTKMMEELLFDVDALGNSQPLSKITCSMMEQNKQTSLKRIDELVGFLEELRRNVVQIDTTLLR